MKKIVGRAATAAVAVAGGLLLVNGTAFAAAPLVPAATAGVAGAGQCDAGSEPQSSSQSHNHSVVGGRPSGRPGAGAGECAKHINPGPKCPPPCPPGSSTTVPGSSTSTTATTTPPTTGPGTSVPGTTAPTTTPPTTTPPTTKPPTTMVPPPPPTAPPTTGPSHVLRPPTPVEQPPGRQLPVTGTWTGVLAAAGVAILAVGGGLLVASRRRLDRASQ